MVGLKVLYVDDDELVRSAFFRQMAKRGMRVQAAESAVRALEYLESSEFDVVVSDLNMPGMDGLALLREIRDAGTSVPFILTTGLTDCELGSSVQPVTVVHKPWNFDSLEATIRQSVLRSHPRDRRPVSVLIVENNPDEAEILQVYLQADANCEYVTQVLPSLARAVDELERRDVDLIITDLELPDCARAEVVERLRKAAAGAAILVAANSDDEELAVGVVTAGAQDYLVKSYMQPAPFRRRVRLALERKRTEKRLACMAGTDELTGLPNRGTFEDRLDEILARNRRTQACFGVAFLDLDGFKPINDRLGHDAGDELLRLVAVRIREVMRDYDTCGRIGGDEFGILIEAPCSEHDAETILSRLIARVSEPYALSNGAMAKVSASVGLAMHPAVAATRESLIRAADEAMYSSKHAGGARYTVAGRARVQVGTASLEDRLRRAVEQEELSIHFQPIVEIGSGRIDALESLLRWNPSPDEMVPPSVFVPLLESMGLMVDVGAWVLDRTVGQLARWDSMGLPDVRVCVNVSPQQFEHGNLVEVVTDALSRHGVVAERLELEITESTLMRNTRSSNTILSALKDEGVGLAIDDFGSGYSSLAYLHRFRVDTLKIDGAFVEQVGRCREAQTITSAILSLARQLRLEVVAEGVETQAQLEFLQARGCRLGQGYHLARPRDARNTQRLLNAQRPSPLRVIEQLA